MKKIAPIVAIAFLGAMFTSCKKDYTCECTTTVAGVSSTGTMQTGKLSKADAKAKCEEGSGTYTANGVTATVSCGLK